MMVMIYYLLQTIKVLELACVFVLAIEINIFRVHVEEQHFHADFYMNKPTLQR